MPTAHDSGTASALEAALTRMAWCRKLSGTKRREIAFQVKGVCEGLRGAYLFEIFLADADFQVTAEYFRNNSKAVNLCKISGQAILIHKELLEKNARLLECGQSPIVFCDVAGPVIKVMPPPDFLIPLLLRLLEASASDSLREFEEIPAYQMPTIAGFILEYPIVYVLDRSSVDNEALALRNEPLTIISVTAVGETYPLLQCSCPTSLNLAASMGQRWDELFKQRVQKLGYLREIATSWNQTANLPKVVL